MLLASPWSVFHKKFTMSELNSKYVFHSNDNGTRTASVGVPARISKFYASTDSEHKFNKTVIENDLPIEFNLGSSLLEPAVITTTLCSAAN